MLKTAPMSFKMQTWIQDLVLFPVVLFWLEDFPNLDLDLLKLGYDPCDFAGEYLEGCPDEETEEGGSEEGGSEEGETDEGGSDEGGTEEGGE